MDGWTGQGGASVDEEDPTRTGEGAGEGVALCLSDRPLQSCAEYSVLVVLVFPSGVARVAGVVAVHSFSILLVPIQRSLWAVLREQYRANATAKEFSHVLFSPSRVVSCRLCLLSLSFALSNNTASLIPLLRSLLAFAARCFSGFLKRRNGLAYYLVVLRGGAATHNATDERVVKRCNKAQIRPWKPKRAVFWDLDH